MINGSIGPMGPRQLCVCTADHCGWRMKYLQVRFKDDLLILNVVIEPVCHLFIFNFIYIFILFLMLCILINNKD